jgi:transcriptional antiterminator Rof (Rho-off)
LEFKIIGRSGCGDFYPILLVLEEEVIFTIEARDIKELESKLEGTIVKTEGEDCILLTQQSVFKLLESELLNQEELLKLWKWWRFGDTVKIENKEGKLFIVK